MKTNSTLALIIIAGFIANAIILSSGCTDDPAPTQTPVVIPTYTPTSVPTPVPTPIVTPTPAPVVNPMIVLSRFDYNGDGMFGVDELQDIRDVKSAGFLTPEEMEAYVILFGNNRITPNPTPRQTIIPTPKPEDSWQGWDDYYNMDCPVVVTGNVYDYLESWEWDADHQYEEDVFDCSEMSAYMEWMLENNGYHTVIVLDDIAQHAWICVEFDDGYLAYECTGCYWVYESDDKSYYEGDVYESLEEIEEMMKQYGNGEEVFVGDFVWWD